MGRLPLPEGWTAFCSNAFTRDHTLVASMSTTIPAPLQPDEFNFSQEDFVTNPLGARTLEGDWETFVREFQQVG
jgi:hypothetical protein